MISSKLLLEVHENNSTPVEVHTIFVPLFVFTGTHNYSVFSPYKHKHNCVVSSLERKNRLIKEK
jgi:hypothetical protein